MSYVHPDDIDDDIDLEDEDESSEDGAVEGTTAKRNFTLGLDEYDIAQELEGLPDIPLIRGLIDRVVRLGRLLGDKDQMVAEACADTAGSLRTLLLELQKDPSNLVMSVLGQMSKEDQLEVINDFMEHLVARKHRLMRGGEN